MLTKEKKKGIAIDQEIVGLFLIYEGRYLLFRRSAYKKYGALQWAICAGRKEKGEDWRSAALRELKEETGLHEGVMLSSENIFITMQIMNQ